MLDLLLITSLKLLMVKKMYISKYIQVAVLSTWTKKFLQGKKIV